MAHENDRSLSPSHFYSLDSENGRIIILEIPAASHAPVTFNRQAYIRVGMQLLYSLTTGTKRAIFGPKSSHSPGRKASQNIFRRLRMFSIYSTLSIFPPNKTTHVK